MQQVWLDVEVARASTLVLLGALAGLALVSCGMEVRECHDMDCTDALSIHGTLPTSPETIIVALCLDQRCGASGAVAKGNSAASSGDLAFSVSRNATSDELWVGLTLEANALPARDGDLLELTVRDRATQLVIAQESWTLDYQPVHPNGAGCPPTCQEAKLELGD